MPYGPALAVWRTMTLGRYLLLTWEIVARRHHVSFDYDMMPLASEIAFFAVDDFHRGFSPWQKTLLSALWITPLLARSVAHIIMVPVGVPAMIAVFVPILRRSEIFCSAKLTPRLKSHDIAAFKS